MTISISWHWILAVVLGLIYQSWMVFFVTLLVTFTISYLMDENKK